MFRTRKALAALAVMGLMLAITPAAVAQSSVSEKIDKAVCRAVMTTARPSTVGRKIDIVSRSISIVDDRTGAVTYVVQWRGLWTDKLYESVFTIRVSRSTHAFQIAVHYDDNCYTVPLDLRIQQKLVKCVNRVLDSAP